MRNLIDQKFGTLTVLSYVGLIGGGQKKRYGIHKGYHTWLCECHCGKIVPVREVKLLAGHTKSCGCWKKTVKPAWTLKEGEAAKNLLYRNYMDSASKRNHSFTLSKEEFIGLTSQDCHYCGEKPLRSVRRAHLGTNSHKRGMNGDYLYNGLDRVDNTLGYTLENCVPCCWPCNELKNRRSYKEFTELVWKIAKNLKKKK